MFNITEQKSYTTNFKALPVKWVKCYIMLLPRLSYIYWLIHFKVQKSKLNFSNNNNNNNNNEKKIQIKIFWNRIQ